MKSLFYASAVGALLICFLFIGCDNSPSPKKVVETEQAKILHDQINWDGHNTANAYGAIIYVPIYSSVYHQSGKIFDLTSTLSIHNVDLDNAIQLTRVNYYNTEGQLIRKYIDQPVSLSPFQTKQFVIPSIDKKGGTGANFVVQWISQNRVIPPITEAIMISTTQSQGLSFSTTGKVIQSLHNQ